MDRSLGVFLATFGLLSLAYSVSLACHGAPLGGETTLTGLLGVAAIVLAWNTRWRSPRR